jgi:hypothetical protein
MTARRLRDEVLGVLGVATRGDDELLRRGESDAAFRGTGGHLPLTRSGVLRARAGMAVCLMSARSATGSLLPSLPLTALGALHFGQWKLKATDSDLKCAPCEAACEDELMPRRRRPPGNLCQQGCVLSRPPRLEERRAQQRRPASLRSRRGIPGPLCRESRRPSRPQRLPGPLRRESRRPSRRLRLPGPLRRESRRPSRRLRLPGPLRREEDGLCGSSSS